MLVTVLLLLEWFLLYLAQSIDQTNTIHSMNETFYIILILITTVQFILYQVDCYRIDCYVSSSIGQLILYQGLFLNHLLTASLTPTDVYLVFLPFACKVGSLFYLAYKATNPSQTNDQV